MKASWNWLTDYVTVKAPAREVAARLTMAGLMVEGIEETAEDIIFDVEITSNRPDWLSHLGIAREIAALYGLAPRVPDVKAPETAEAVKRSAALEVEDLHLCPLYTGRIIKGVKVGPSPAWLREKIEAVGLRSVNNIVDATNYVMYECGQPLHAFDLARLKSNKVVVRPAVPGEHITLIDGSKHTLRESDLLIADESAPIAIAGVMGGLDSEIGTDTVDVFLESARFDQLSVRLTAKRLGLSSDASYRFERGVDLAGVDWASRRCADVILDVAGGKLCKGVLSAGIDRPPVRTVTLRTSHMKRLLGLDIPIEQSRAILASLGFILRGGSPDTTVVEVPSFRGDVKEEADLVEEVGRIYGYDKVPVATGITIETGRRTDRQRVTEAAEKVLTACGFYGCVSYSLVSGELSRSISPWTDGAPVYIENRAGQENAFMRPSLVPSLLNVRKTNEDHRNADADLYEIAHVYLPSGGEVPDQPLIAAALTGAPYETLKGMVEALLEELGGEGADFAPSAYSFLSDSRAADIMLGENRIGYIGAISEPVRQAVDLRSDVCVAEINLSFFESLPGRQARFARLQRYPGIERDIAAIVAEQTTWRDVRDTVLSSRAAHLESISFVSIYRGEPIESGRKSIAFRMIFRSPERTLTSDEADAAQAEVVRALSEKLGARLR